MGNLEEYQKLKEKLKDYHQNFMWDYAEMVKKKMNKIKEKHIPKRTPEYIEFSLKYMGVAPTTSASVQPSPQTLTPQTSQSSRSINVGFLIMSPAPFEMKRSYDLEINGQKWGTLEATQYENNQKIDLKPMRIRQEMPLSFKLSSQGKTLDCKGLGTMEIPKGQSAYVPVQSIRVVFKADNTGTSCHMVWR